MLILNYIFFQVSGSKYFHFPPSALSRVIRYSDVIFADYAIIKVVHGAAYAKCSQCRSLLSFVPQVFHRGRVAISGHSSEHKSGCSNHPKGLRVDLAISLA